MAASCRTLLCEICANRGQTTVATGYCSECREIYCCQCTKQHRAAENTQTHKCVIFDSTQGESDQVECETCKEGVNENIRATYLCGECRQLYCKPCKQLHSIFKATSDHDLFEINFTVSNPRLHTESVNFTSDFEKFTLSDKNVSDSGLVPGRTVRMNSVNFTSDFEKFTLSDTNVSDSDSASYQDQIDRVNSSDFEGFGTQQEKADLSALFSVFQTSSGQLKIGLGKGAMDEISAKITGTFSAKLTQRISMKSLLNSSRKMGRDQHNCWFHGIISLNDGRLILLDMENEKLKMFDKKYNIIATEPTKRYGWGMTKISEEEIVVVTYSDTVYFYKVTKNKFELNKQRKINLGCEGYGISYNRGMLAVLCYKLGDNPLIKIYSTTGEEMSQISLPKGSDIVNLDSEEDRIYLSSIDNDTFSCISQHGKLLWKLDFEGRDVVEFHNCLLVADFNGAIVLCTKDGRYRRTIIQDVEHLSKAECIAYNPVTQQLYVTRFDCDDITIIQLQSDLSCRLP